MRFLTAGDSHGEYLVGIIEGFPAGFKISTRDIERELGRRRRAYGRSARQKLEGDSVNIASGLWRGTTTGAPIALLIQNRGRKVAGKPGGALGRVPRPGHADLAGALKYDLDEVPPVSERASARSTTMRVAIGAIARGALREFGIDILAHVTSISEVDADPDRTSFDALKRRVHRSPIYCGDKRAADRMIEAIKSAKKDGNSLGGAVEVIVTGLVPGLGTHVSHDRKLDARLAAAMMSIHSVKAVEIGDGLATYRTRGADAHDAVFLENGRIVRRTNRAGGIEGGMTNGEDIIMRLFAKPIPTSLKRLASFNMKTMKPTKAPFVRSDVCVLPPLAVIAEGAAAWEVLSAMAEKFGGDTMKQMHAGYDSFVDTLRKRGA